MLALKTLILTQIQLFHFVPAVLAPLPVPVPSVSDPPSLISSSLKSLLSPGGTQSSHSSSLVVSLFLLLIWNPQLSLISEVQSNLIKSNFGQNPELVIDRNICHDSGTFSTVLLSGSRVPLGSVGSVTYYSFCCSRQFNPWKTSEVP